MELGFAGDLPEQVLFRIVRGDARRRAFGTPRNPRAPTIVEFNPRFTEIRADDLATTIVSRRHGIFADQALRVSQLSHSEADRIAAARLMLLKMGLDSGDPRWSSDVLDRVLNAVVETPQGGVGDMISALSGVLGDYSPELTGPVAGLIKDLVVKCFTGYRASYDAVDWKRLVGGLGPQAPTAQLYLALLAVPAQFVTSQLAETIRNALACTPFSAEAASALAT
jgi:hypothetical protein